MSRKLRRDERRDGADKDFPISETKLYVGNIPYSWDREDLSAHFLPFGALTWAFVAHRGNKPRGFGFVRFKDPPDAKRACAKMNGHVVNGKEKGERRTLYVKFTVEKTEKKKEPRELICHECGKPGHIAPHCPLRRRKLREMNGSDTRNEVDVDNVQREIGPPVAKEIGPPVAKEIGPPVAKDRSISSVPSDRSVKRKRISVIIPSYNRHTKLLRAINSVKMQTVFVRGEFEREVIVVNDASTEQKYYVQHNQDVMMIHLPTNSNKRPGFVRNVGLRVATGDYIAFLDDDDVWLPMKLEMQFKVMNALNCGMSCTSAAYINSMTKKVEIPDIYATLPPMLSLEDMSSQNPIVCSSVLLHRDAVRNFLFSSSPYAEDYGLWKQVMKITNCAVVQDVHVHLQTSEESATLRSIQRTAVNHFFSAPVSNSSTVNLTPSMFPSPLFTEDSRHDPKNLVSMFLE